MALLHDSLFTKIVLLVVLVAAVLSFSIPWKGNGENDSYSFKNGAEELSVKTSSSDIQINTVEGQQTITAELLGTNQTGLLKCTEKNGKAEISINNRTGLFSRINPFNTSGRLIVNVPSSLLNEVTINSLAGNIDIREINATTININNASGEIYFAHMYGEDINIYSMSGNIKGDDFNGDTLAVHNTSGNTDLQKIDSREVKARSISGNISIGSIVNAEKITSSTTSGSGSIYIDTGDGLSFTGKTISGNIRVNNENVQNGTSIFGNGEIETELTSTSGNFDIFWKD